MVAQIRRERQKCTAARCININNSRFYNVLCHAASSHEHKRKRDLHTRVSIDIRARDAHDLQRPPDQTPNFSLAIKHADLNNILLNVGAHQLLDSRSISRARARKSEARRAIIERRAI